MKLIAMALSKAQAEMGRALKDSTNPAFKSKYADLSSVMDACVPALNKNGIAVLQPFFESEIGGRVVKTVFIHESGETLECGIPLIVGKNDMQGLGSAITYARRYGLMMMAGIAPEDDDGNAAVASRGKNPVGEALAETWRNAVLDSLPDDASDDDKAHAFAVAICDDFKDKGLKALENRWLRHSSMIGAFEKRYPALHQTVVDAYENRKNDLESAVRETANMQG